MIQYKFLPEQSTSVSPVLPTSTYKDLIIFTRVSFGEMAVSVEKEGHREGGLFRPNNLLHPMHV